MSKHWYTNGEIEKMYTKGSEPEGFFRGRLLQEITTKGYMWYNDGVQSILLAPTASIPPGFKKGVAARSTTLGYRIYNNGEVNISIKPGEEVPDGFSKGRCEKSNTKLKEANKRKRVYRYNNGIEEIKIKHGEDVPVGYKKGRLTRADRKRNRDKEYLARGYIPLREVIEKYGKAGYDRLKEELDIISLPDPYVYVHKDSVEKIKEYSKVNHSFSTSLKEQQIVDFCKSIYQGRIKTHCKSVLKTDDRYYELDIYIPDKNVAIEFNGNYWHDSQHVPKNYHLTKTRLCLEQGIRLIHIFEYEWDEKKDLCKSIISSALGVYKERIYARDCEVKEVSSKLAADFLNSNHIQGLISASYRLGLFYRNELVQLIAIGKSRFKVGEYELLRMCTKVGVQVLGGFSRLMKYQPYSKLVSYVDRSKFTGASYLTSGWIMLNETIPNYRYYKHGKLITRIQAQKHRLKKLLGEENFDVSKTEIENMLNNGWHQIYDCGNIKVEFKKIITTTEKAQ